MSVPSRLVLALSSGLLLAGAPVASAQMLETETARLLHRGALVTGGNLEYQTSSEGTEAAVPFLLEYGILDRLELMVEPVAHTIIRPRAGNRASGPGDLEATLTWLARPESRLPALAFAVELKVPTARNALIGTGRADLALWGIASRRFGRLDTHANVNYTIVGRPAGAQLTNIVGGAVAGVLSLGASGTNQLFSEVLANSPSISTPESATPPPGGTAVPEAAGGEIVGTLGAAHWVAGRRLKLIAGISVDNNGAVLFRPGFTWRLN